MEIKQRAHIQPIVHNSAYKQYTFKARLPKMQVTDVFYKTGTSKKPALNFQNRIRNVCKGVTLPFKEGYKRVDFSSYKKPDSSNAFEESGTEYLYKGRLSSLFFLNGNGKKLLKTLKESKNLTLESSLSIKNYDKEETFDFPIKFAIAVLNTFRQKGNAHIVEKVPELFEGLNQRKLFEKTDKMREVLDNYKTNVFKIDGRYFTAKYVDSGAYGKVFKISDIDNKCQPAALKIFHNPYKVSSQGIFNEIGLYRELNRQKVNDIPEFYMANPIGSYDGTSSEGGWMLTEFVESKTPIKNCKQSISLTSFMKKHSLKHFDDNRGTRVGVYTVDLGNIQARAFTKDTLIDKFYGPRDLEMLLKGMRKGETVEDLIEALKKLLDSKKT